MPTAAASRMPALFIGHGSPALLLEPNGFTPAWREAAQNMPRPSAVLCISAHWESMDSAATAAEHPKLIYDFQGFAPELYTLRYPAPGAPELAARLLAQQQGVPLWLDEARGLDHGCWAVMRHMYPQADVPVLQLSLPRSLNAREHLALARQLRPLRDEGVLILGSGNMVHNLRLLDWPRMDEPDLAFDWARKAQQQLLERVRQRDLDALADYARLGEDVRRAIPTPEHFLPLLWVLAQQDEDDAQRIFNTGFVGGSLDMSCVQIG